VKDSEKPKQHLETQRIGDRSRIGGHGLQRSGAEHNLESGRPVRILRQPAFEPGAGKLQRSPRQERVGDQQQKLPKSVLIVPIAVQGKADEKPSLTFQCVGHNCQLAAIHAGHGELGAIMPARRLSKSDREELAMVTVPLEISRGQ
jgi:hypothetical protein